MKKVLLAVLAHPDDESFGLGGTLARYAAEGVEVHIGIATDGVAGSVAGGFEHTKENLIETRSQELESAVNILGAQLHKLGYRDSGYIADPANQHPQAFINIDNEIAVESIVRLIREVRPQVVITHDETGGYYHPDHIHCCEVTTAAFHAAGDPNQFPFSGPTFTPERLYYSAFSEGMVKIFTMLMRIRGRNPKKAGRNKDIDFTKLGIPRKKIHAKINYEKYWDIKRMASAQHGSQGGGTSNMRALPQWLQRRLLANEYFIRVVPPTPDGYRENDLFTGLD